VLRYAERKPVTARLEPFSTLALFAILASACDASGTSSTTGVGGYGGASGDGGYRGDGGCYWVDNEGWVGCPVFCGDFPWEGDGHTPTSGCFECAVFGDTTLAENGGACSDLYVECVGTSRDCSDAGNPDCCELAACVRACPNDDPSTPNDELFDCECTNNGSQCIEEPSGSTTCVAGHSAGLNDLTALGSCVLEICAYE
jgi:hypothetical protein